jgi:putative transposase
MKRAWRRRMYAAVTGLARRRSYKWKSKFGDMEVSDARRLRTLEDETAGLKKLPAKAMLHNVVLKDVASIIV